MNQKNRYTLGENFDDIPSDIEEGVEDIREVDEFLKEHDAAGILIGGKAFAFIAGAHPIEIEKRKDVDSLVIQGGQSLSHDTPYDFFLPDGTGAYRNRNDFTLPYHIHYLGEPLEPGIYLPPPEVILLTESEMSTRRAIDRLIPDIIQHRFNPVASSFNTLKLKDIVIEFPGDMSWFGSHLPSFPLQVNSQNEEGVGRRTYFSFRSRLESALPKTAFPTSKDVRAPEFNALDIFQEVELEPEEIRHIGSELVKNGFVKEGVSYILEKEPMEADNFELLGDLLSRDNISDYPLQVAEALAMWLESAKENAFMTMLFFGNKLDQYFSLRANSEIAEYYSKKLKKLADSIGEKYGMRFQELRERVSKLDFESFVQEDGKAYQPQLKKYLKNVMIYAIHESFDKGLWKDNDMKGWVDNYAFQEFLHTVAFEIGGANNHAWYERTYLKWDDLFQDDLGEGKVDGFFTEQGEEWLKELEITDEEIEKVYDESNIKVNSTIRNALSNPDWLLRSCWDQKVLRREERNTSREVVRGAIQNGIEKGELDAIKALCTQINDEVDIRAQLKKRKLEDRASSIEEGYTTKEEVLEEVEQVMAEQVERFRNAAEVIPEFLGFESMKKLEDAIIEYLRSKEWTPEECTQKDEKALWQKLRLYFGKQYFKQLASSR